MQTTNTQSDTANMNSTDSVSLRHYQLRHCLGEGGFGQVYEAWDSKLHRSVAVKQLKRLQGQAQTTGLLKEARLAASLQHPAFVKIFAVEDDDDTPSIIMELVPGLTLKQVLQQGALPEQQALDIIRQVAAAMQVAHASGLIHGDLKPSNLMLEPDGRVRILDFGLASQADVQATTSVSQLDPQGTIAYMAPERMLGAPSSVQSDVYALGVILYECITGHRPFADMSGLALAAALMQSASETWEFPPQLNSSVVRLIVAMTARQVERRLTSLALVTAQITPLLSQYPDLNANTVQKAPANANRSGKLARRIGAAVVASLLLAFGIWKAVPYLDWDMNKLKPYSESLTMKQGLENLNQYDRPGSLEQATQNFETILKHDPNNAAAVAGMSLVYSYRYANETKDETLLKQADASAQQALKLNNLLALSHVAQAQTFSAQGKSELALAAYEKALALDSDNQIAWYGKISVLTRLKKYDEAKNFAQIELNKHPEERHFADLLGIANYQQGNLVEAERAFRLSIKIQPDAVFSYANLSGTLMQKNQQNQAMQVLQQGLQIRPNALLYGNLGNVLFMRGDYVGAADAFEQAVSPVKGNPADYLGWANLADTLLWIPGRKEEAKRAYEKARNLMAPRLARAPNDASLTSQMGLYSARVGDKSQAQDMLKKALQLAPKDVMVHFRAGLAYELLGDRVAALAEIAQAKKLGYPVKFVEAEPDLLALRKDERYVQQHD